MKFILAILSTTLVTALMGCEKERLPKPSQRGRNIVAWRTDGDAYIAKGESLIGGNRASYTLDVDSTLRIWGFASAGNLVTIRCRFEGVNASLPIFVCSSTLSFGCSGGAPMDCNYQTPPEHGGAVTVTYYDGDIIAGTFQMDVMNEAGEVRHVTDGRFDIRLD